MADNSATVYKRNLENTSMYVYHIREGSQSTSLFFTIKILKVMMMKDKVVYTKPLSYKDWILNVLKNKKVFILTLCTLSGCTYDTMCKVRYNNDCTANPIFARKISDHEHIMEVPYKIVFNPLNEFLKEDILVFELHSSSMINCKFLRPVAESTIAWKNEHVVRMKDKKEETEVGLANVLTEYAWINGTKFTDFKVRTESTTTNVNKCIIAARSKYFFDFFKENPEAKETTLDISYDVFKLALQFMYCGTFQVGNMSSILQLMKLAKTLEMKQLYEMCYNFVKYSIDEGNVQVVKKIRSDIGEEELKKAADEFPLVKRTCKQLRCLCNKKK